MMSRNYAYLDVIYLLQYKNEREKYCRHSEIDFQCVVIIALNKLVIMIYNMLRAPFICFHVPPFICNRQSVSNEILA